MDFTYIAAAVIGFDEMKVANGGMEMKKGSVWVMGTFITNL